MNESLQIARRDFLKKSLVAATAAMATSAAVLQTSAKAESLPISWKEEADVVIVGSGIAGICAAIEAASAGAKVIVLEKDQQPGGCAKFSGGHMTVAGTHLQAQAQVEDHPDWLYDDMIADGERVAVPELIRKYVDAGPEHVLWLERLGIKFAPKFQDDSNTDRIKPGIGRGHMIAGSPDYPGGPHEGGLGLIIMLLKASNERGTSLRLQHTMTRLVRTDKRGPVIGVEVESDGKSFAIKAHNAVVVTTGGWSGNARMAVAEDPRITADIFPDCWPYHVCLGEGHLAAVDVGGELSNMGFGGYLVPRWGTRVYQIWEPPILDTVPSIRTGVAISDFQNVILVKSDGLRYINEKLGDPKGTPLSGNPKFSFTPSGFPNHPFIEAYLNLSERPRNVWAVTDHEGAKAFGWLDHIAELNNPTPKTGLALYPGMVAIADNLHDLALKMSVDSAGLQATALRYNSLADAGKDSDFGKPAPFKRIASPPFYAVKMALMKHTRRNGIRVNTHGQVLDRSDFIGDKAASPRNSVDDESVIPRLYAAGECANYLGRSHGHGTLGIYSFYGRIAGKNAAAESQLQ
jgi:succinate dehydrogenase/fumarate reductase flavoprotein subunit